MRDGGGEHVASNDPPLAIDGAPPTFEHALDFGKGKSYLGEEEIAAVTSVLRSRNLFRYGGQPASLVSSFEQKLSGALGVHSVLACSSGTAALRLAFLGLGIGPGDEVLVPAITFIATAGAVVAQGAVPVFVDVDETFTIDPSAIEALITPRTKAIVAVHIFGVACNMKALSEIARRHSLLIVEDTAQALGAQYEDRALGAWGDAAAFSFQEEKHISAGEGGAVAFRSVSGYERALRYHDHGGDLATLKGSRRLAGECLPFWGENLRMSELQGAVLSVQIGRLPMIVSQMREARAHLVENLLRLHVPIRSNSERSDFGTGVPLAVRDERARQFCLQALLAEGIPAGLLYNARPVYDTEHVLSNRTSSGNDSSDDRERQRYHRGMCPVAERLLATTVGLAVGPRYTRGDTLLIAETVASIYRREKLAP